MKLYRMKTIIITGANGNLGTATVRNFLDRGNRVIGVDNGGNNLEFASTNKNFELKAVDLSNEDASSKFISETISRYNKIDAGLLLVGGFAAGAIDTTPGADIKKMFTLNFETAYYLVRPLFQHMLQNGYGRIVLVGARPALNAAQGKNLLAYALSKSLLFKLAEFLNESAKGKNVVVSVIVPSTIDTAINRKSMPDVDPGNWVKAEQIAEVMEFICSDAGLPIREPIYKIYNNA
ncbi:MAG: SDR family oxidoreductase [Bacteroidetes bacterium]|nr:MAG: SDR family oxidoreductase [Bacteroidota bacterium]